MSLGAVLFDLDGTLADTAPDLGAALNRLLNEEALPSQPYAAIRPLASHGARGLIELGFGLGPDHARFAELRARFLDLYAAELCVHTRLFDGVNELLAGLEARGLKWGIVTNKPMRFTDPLIEQLPLPSAPQTCVSGDTVGVPKPDPKPMLHAAAELGVDPLHCVYVGDAERDIEAGRRVGMTTVLADWGYIAHDDEPHNWGADHRSASPQALLALIDELRQSIRP